MQRLKAMQDNAENVLVAGGVLLPGGARAPLGAASLDQVPHQVPRHSGDPYGELSGPPRSTRSTLSFYTVVGCH
jgi:hypothetical protein